MGSQPRENTVTIREEEALEFPTLHNYNHAQTQEVALRHEKGLVVLRFGVGGVNEGTE